MLFSLVYQTLLFKNSPTKVAGGFAVSSSRLSQKCNPAGSRVTVLSYGQLKPISSISFKFSKCLLQNFLTDSFLMNIIFLKLQSDPCHAEEDCDDADAGWPAAEPSQRTPRRALCGCLSRERNSLQPISAALCQGAAVGLNTSSYSHLSTHQPPSHMLTHICLRIVDITLYLKHCFDIYLMLMILFLDLLSCWAPTTSVACLCCCFYVTALFITIIVMMVEDWWKAFSFY